MKKIITLTVNPAIDKSTTVAGIRPNSKLRCAAPVYEAGGGGINVSRAVQKLGGTSLSVYLAGGPTGIHLENLMEGETIVQHVVPIQGWTRENLSVTDTTNNQQYRFGMPGPEVKEEEWQISLEQLGEHLSEGDYLVASGSLPLGIPEDFYAKVAFVAKKTKARLILDTSGVALLRGANAGVFLLKPNLSELGTLCGVKSISVLELEELARNFLEKKTCEVMVVSLGARGAMLATLDTIEHIAAPTVHQKSTIGAGDSMVAGMVLSLARGKSFREMARYGVACGTAATMSPGTELCRKENADKLYQWIKSNKTKDGNQ